MLAELVQAVAGLVHGGADILHARKHGRQGDEFAVKRIRHQARQGGLAHAGRAPQDHRMGLARLEREAQGLARAQQMRLADDFVQGGWPQGLGQRLARCGGKEIRHNIYRVRMQRPRMVRGRSITVCEKLIINHIRALGHDKFKMIGG